jgi:chromosome segregation ATPase
MLDKQIERLKNQLDHQSKELSKLRDSKSKLEFELSAKESELTESKMYKGLYDKCQIDITNLQEENIKTIGKKDEEFAKVDE